MGLSMHVGRFPLFFLNFRVGLALAAAFSAVPAGAQSPGSGLHCGDRPPGSYAVVLDVSSSLRRDPGSSDATEERYVDVLSLLNGLLCQGETLKLYTFVPDAGARMEAFATLAAGDRSPDRLRKIVAESFARDPKQTDLHLALLRIRDDVFLRGAPRAVFLLTDGSFYPLGTEPRERRLKLVRDRMTVFAELADTMARDGRPLFAVGIGAREADAVDPDLHPVWPGRREERLWRRPRDGAAIDLKEASGDTLLRLVFGGRYMPADSFSPWHALVGGPGAVWTGALGYTTGWELTLDQLRTVSMQHLVFLPPPGADDGVCTAVRTDTGTGRPPGQSARIGPAHQRLCSLQAPTPEEILRIARLGGRSPGGAPVSFAFRQRPAYSASGPETIHGLHDLVLAREGETCQDDLLATHFRGGRTWPLSLTTRDGRPRQRLTIVKRGETRGNDTVGLVEYSDGCVVPNFALNGWQRETGDYVLFFGQGSEEWVQPRRISPPRLDVVSIKYRPGGFPFPPDRLALLLLCVRDTSELATGAPVRVELGDTVVDLARQAPGSGCAREAGSGISYGFRGVVLLPTSRLSFARVVLSGPEEASGHWIPISLEPDGQLFLALRLAVFLFLSGMAIQVWYIRTRWLKHSREMPMRRLFSAGLSVVMSGTIVVVIAQCGVMMWETEMRHLALPVPFMLLVFVHGLKLLAAGFVPEIVEDTLL
jgi:hypothetical protein